MASSAKTMKEGENNVTDATAVDDERVTTDEELDSGQLAITVKARDQNWRFHCHKDRPLANTMFTPLENILGGKCMLHYDSATARYELIDRTKTPSFYGMIYDDIVYLGGVIRLSE